MRLSHNLKLLMVASFLQGSAINPINSGSQVANTSELKPITQEIQNDQEFWQRAPHWDRACSKYLVEQTNKINGRIVLIEDAHGVIFENTRHGKILFNLPFSGHTDIVEHYAIYFAEKLKKHAHYYQSLHVPMHVKESHQTFMEFVRDYQDKLAQPQFPKTLVVNPQTSRQEVVSPTLDSAQIAALVIQKLEEKKEEKKRQDELTRVNLELHQMKALLAAAQRNTRTKKHKPITPQSSIYGECEQLIDECDQPDQALSEADTVSTTDGSYTTSLRADMRIIRKREGAQNRVNPLVQAIQNIPKLSKKDSTPKISAIDGALPPATADTYPSNPSVMPHVSPVSPISSVVNPLPPEHSAPAPSTVQPLTEHTLAAIPVEKNTRASTPSDLSSDLRQVSRAQTYERKTLEQDREQLKKTRARSAEAAKKGHYFIQATTIPLGAPNTSVVIPFVSPSELLTPANS